MTVYIYHLNNWLIMKQQKLKTLLAFGAIYIIWGSTYLATRYAVETIPPLMMIGIRSLTAGIILYLISRFKSQRKDQKGKYSPAVYLRSIVLFNRAWTACMGSAICTFRNGGCTCYSGTFMDYRNRMVFLKGYTGKTKGNFRIISRFRRHCLSYCFYYRQYSIR